MLKGEEIINKLPIMKSIWDLRDLPKDMRGETFTQTLNRMFGDLQNAVYTKVKNEEKG